MTESISASLKFSVIWSGEPGRDGAPEGAPAVLAAPVDPPAPAVPAVPALPAAPGAPAGTDCGCACAPTSAGLGPRAGAVPQAAPSSETIRATRTHRTAAAVRPPDSPRWYPTLPSDPDHGPFALAAADQCEQRLQLRTLGSVGPGLRIEAQAGAHGEAAAALQAQAPPSVASDSASSPPEPTTSIR